MSKGDIFDFVLDCSITMAWCFEDESTNYTDGVLQSLQNKTAIVPAIWSLEVANVLLLAKKKKRITEAQVANFTDSIAALPIIIDHSSTTRIMHSLFLMADKTNLTIYDACYLELALREQIPLLTLDKQLIKAAKELHIPLTIS